MPERLKSITEARRNLPSLSQAAQKRMDRYIITHQGQPQSVLVGFAEYQSMKTAVELLHTPERIEGILAGLKQLEEGQGVSVEEMQARLRPPSGVATAKRAPAPQRVAVKG